MGRVIQKKQEYLNVPKHYCLNLYNLTSPAKSMILLAPLAKEAGGYEWCRAKSAQEQPDRPDRVFANVADPDYQTILRAIETAKTELHTLKRFDMPDFRPTRHYVREMIRYGILPASIDRMKDRIDVYQIDQAYWRSLWYQPPGRGLHHAVATPASSARRSG